MRKPDFCICENKYADQLRGDREADQRLCFRYKASTIPLLPKNEIPNLEPSSVVVQPGLCRTWSENHDRFSHNEAHISLSIAFTLPGQLHVIDLLTLQGVQRRMVLVVNYFVFWNSFIFLLCY